MSVRSQKVLSICPKFGLYGRGRRSCYTTACRMTRSKVKVKVTEVRNLRKYILRLYA